MMITETEVVARFTQLNAQVLEHWIAVGWLKPHRDDEGFLFDDADIARTNLLCDLCYDMDLATRRWRWCCRSWTSSTARAVSCGL